MQLNLRTFFVSLAIFSGIGLVAAVQVKDDQPTPAQAVKMLEIMRRVANRNSRSLARFVQAHGIKSGKYDQVMTDYASDFGGEFPINPCTDSTTGYAVTIFDDGKQANVAATSGSYCGQWQPTTWILTLRP